MCVGGGTAINTRTQYSTHYQYTAASKCVAALLLPHGIPGTPVISHRHHALGRISNPSFSTTENANYKQTNKCVYKKRTLPKIFTKNHI